MPSRKNLRLRTDEDRSRILLDALQEAILIHEPEGGGIVDVNAAATQLYGFSREQLLQKTMGDLSVGIAPCGPEDALAWMRKAAAGEPQSFEWLAQNAKGRIFWVEIHLRLAILEGAPKLIAAVREIGDRKRLESEHKARLKHAEAENAVLLALAEAGTNAHLAVTLLARHLAADIGDLAVVELLDANGGLVPKAVDQPYLDGGDTLPDLSQAGTPVAPDTPSAQVAATGTPFTLDDPSGAGIRAALRADLHPFLWRYNAHSLLIVPLRAHGKCLGAITLAKGSASRGYSSEDRSRVQNLADRTGLSLVNAELFGRNLAQAEELRRANAELEARVAARTAELETVNLKLQQMAVEDALTGLANRRKFNEVMEEELRRARRNEGTLSLLMGDVDFFKRYNDHYGHQGGDECLRTVGGVLKRVFRRAGELPARYGGEEFCVVLPGVPEAQALAAAQKLIQALATRALPHEKSEVAPHVTMSLGLASAKVGPETDTDWFVALADEALYRAKAKGRNQVQVAATLNSTPE